MTTRSNSHAPADWVANVIESVRSKGVRLWSENGQLHYKAPKGALTQEEFESLRASRGRIVSLLERAAAVSSGESKLVPLDSAPLTFSQLAHWRLYELREQHHIRHIASATRLRGRLKVDALRKSLSEIVHRHDALRTRIVVLDGVPTQEIAKSVYCDITVSDLTVFPEHLHEAEVHRRIEKFISEQIDLAAAPLFGVHLLKLHDDEYVLIVAMEHIISDIFSLQILLRELFSAYAQTLKGRALSLPAIPVQFAEYALGQRNTLKSWVKKHGSYWKSHLAGCQRLRFPKDKNLRTDTRVGWGVVHIKIGLDLKSELRERSRQRKTTIVMSVFTAYVGLVLSWCNASEGVIQYQTDGRVSATMENTIGYFASALWLRISISEDDSFLDLMNHVTESYCEAYEHADFSYLAANESPPEFARSSCFNWIPQESRTEIRELRESEHAVTCSPVRFENPIMRSLDTEDEPSILLYDNEKEEILGEVWFPLSRFSAETMERFGQNFLVFIKALLRQSDAAVKGIQLL